MRAVSWPIRGSLTCVNKPEVEATDPKFNLAETRAFLNDLHPVSVEEVME